MKPCQQGRRKKMVKIHSGFSTRDFAVNAALYLNNARVFPSPDCITSFILIQPRSWRWKRILVIVPSREVCTEATKVRRGVREETSPRSRSNAPRGRGALAIPIPTFCLIARIVISRLASSCLGASNLYPAEKRPPNTNSPWVGGCGRPRD